MLPTRPLVPPKEIEGIPVQFDENLSIVAESRGIWPRKRIVCGIEFAFLDPGEGRAVLLHEVGHCKLFHLELRLLTLPLLFLRPGICFEIARAHEIAADRFAARHGAKASLIAYLKKIEGDCGMFYPTHQARIEALENLKE